MKTNLLRWLGIVLILEIGLLHIMTAQGEYEEVAYMGYLFVANFFGALVAALGIYHKKFWGWFLGLMIAVGSIAGYAWSRTLGMPGMEVEEWIVPYGVVSLTVEGIFALLFILRPWKMESLGSSGVKISNSWMLIGMFVLASLSIFTYQWDAAVTRAFGQHVISLEKVLESRELSSSELEEEYGVEVALAATSMMGSIVDVRLKIVDPDKAHALLQNQAALLVGQDDLILAPHMHSHNSTRLKEGKIFTVFFPTQQLISSGSEVSLVFGPVRVEPVVVR